MKRGEAWAVPLLVGMISAFALATLLIQNPTGNVTQYQNVYDTQLVSLPIACADNAYLLHTNGAYDTYCCAEDLIGQNTCRRPQTIKVA